VVYAITHLRRLFAGRALGTLRERAVRIHQIFARSVGEDTLTSLPVEIRYRGTALSNAKIM